MRETKDAVTKRKWDFLSGGLLNTWHSFSSHRCVASPHSCLWCMSTANTHSQQILGMYISYGVNGHIHNCSVIGPHNPKVVAQNTWIEYLISLLEQGFSTACCIHVVSFWDLAIFCLGMMLISVCLCFNLFNKNFVFTLIKLLTHMQFPESTAEQQSAVNVRETIIFYTFSHRYCWDCLSLFRKCSLDLPAVLAAFKVFAFI